MTSTATSASTSCWSRRGACRGISKRRSTRRTEANSAHSRASRNPRPSNEDLRRPQLLEEPVDLAADALRRDAETVGDRLHGAGLRACIGGRLVDLADFLGGLERALRGGFGAARDLARGGALLGDGGGNRRGDLADLADGALDRADRVDRAHRRL